MKEIIFVSLAIIFITFTLHAMESKKEKSYAMTTKEFLPEKIAVTQQIPEEISITQHVFEKSTNTMQKATNNPKIGKFVRDDNWESYSH